MLMNLLDKLRGRYDRDAHDIAVALAAQLIWIVMAAGSGAALVFLFGTTSIHKIISSRVSIPAWIILLSAIIVLLSALFLRSIAKKASAVRGRTDATAGNLSLLRERERVRISDRVVRSTRFGRWPQSEMLNHRAFFRQEIDQMVLAEGTDLRRIWNVSSLSDVQRLREMLEKYKGHSNHSIRTYFQIPDHLMPELLVVEGRGASISFPSIRSPYDLDWMIRFKREDLVAVIRDYFDVLWDRAIRILDAGEVVPGCDELIQQVEESLRKAAGT
jgi:hypothetical protein